MNRKPDAMDFVISYRYGSQQGGSGNEVDSQWPSQSYYFEQKPILNRVSPNYGVHTKSVTSLRESSSLHRDEMTRSSYVQSRELQQQQSKARQQHQIHHPVPATDESLIKNDEWTTFETNFLKRLDENVHSGTKKAVTPDTRVPPHTSKESRREDPISIVLRKQTPQLSTRSIPERGGISLATSKPLSVSSVLLKADGIKSIKNPSSYRLAATNEDSPSICLPYLMNLTGHTNSVTGITADNQSKIWSCSLDYTLKVTSSQGFS